MDSITFDLLEREELFFTVTEVVAQRFPQHFEFIAQPRENTGLFILCSDVQATLHIQNGETLRVQNGDVLLLPQGSRYRFVFDACDRCSPPHSYVVNFTTHDAGGTERSFQRMPRRILQGCNLGKLPLSALNRAMHDLPPRPLAVQTRFLEVLSAIFDMIHEQDAEFYPIRSGVKLLRREWTENHKISRYASECGMSESYFHALFRAWANMTPVEYRNRLRISYACSYLKNSDQKVEEIARAVGIEDPFYFSRLFKKITGMTPLEYKRS